MDVGGFGVDEVYFMEDAQNMCGVKVKLYNNN